MYADDTLLVALDSDVAATYMRHIERCGSQYGLPLNWCKAEILPITCVIPKPDSSPIRIRGSGLGNC